MAKHLQRDLDQLKRDLLTLGGIVESSVHKALLALTERTQALVDEVIRTDDTIDQWEVRIEEDCLKALALHQPVAQDLRDIAAIMKINNDLEQIGDLAVNICERVATLLQCQTVPVPALLKPNADLASAMVQQSLDAFVRRDSVAARHIRDLDNTVDQQHRTIVVELKRLMHEQSALIDPCVMLFSISKNVERIADLATSIAEDVVYMVEGEIIRHHHAD